MSRVKTNPMRRPVLCAGRPVSLVILAGGRSRRMGRNKALLPVAGQMLLEHVLGQVEGSFDDILISLSPGQRLTLAGGAFPGFAAGRSARRLKGKTPLKDKGTKNKGTVPEKVTVPSLVPTLRFVRDAVPGQGPMAGVLAGLRAARHDVSAVVACDIPDVPLALLRRMARAAASGHDAVVPVSADGLMEPLFAVYRRTAAGRIEELLASGRRSLLSLFDGLKTLRLPLDNPRRLMNLNTPEDYRAYLETAARRSRCRQAG